MPRDSAPTKARILDAATAEFAQYGLAGARVDRIAERAGANKQLIYAYYGGKETLFDATVEACLDLLFDTVPFTADDLPGYAGRLYEFMYRHGHLVRLARWHILERPGVLVQLPKTAASTVRKIESVAEAQRAGTVDGGLPAADLVAVLLAIIHGLDEFQPEVADEADFARRREAVMAGVRRLVS